MDMLVSRSWASSSSHSSLLHLRSRFGTFSADCENWTGKTMYLTHYAASNFSPSFSSPLTDEKNRISLLALGFGRSCRAAR